MLWWFIAMIIVFSNTDALIAFSNLTVAATALTRNSKLGYTSSCTEPQADMLIWGSGGGALRCAPGVNFVFIGNSYGMVPSV